MTNLQRVEILRASCCIAAADGDISDDELVQLRKLAHELGVGEASLTAMIERARRDPEFYKVQFGVLRDEPLQTLDTLLDCVLANHEVKESEFEVLKGLAVRLGIQTEDFKSRVKDALARRGKGSV